MLFMVASLAGCSSVAIAPTYTQDNSRRSAIDTAAGGGRMISAAGIVIFGDLDEQGRPRAKRPCPRCGREIPVLSIPAEQLKWYGWQQPSQFWSAVEWCGHRIEGIPVPGLTAVGG